MEAEVIFDKNIFDQIGIPKIDGRIKNFIVTGVRYIGIIAKWKWWKLITNWSIILSCYLIATWYRLMSVH